MRCKFLFILILTLTGFQSFSLLQAQQIGSRLYTVADGLVQSEVTTIHQDKKGFIWAGTKMGLSRFDGATFETFRDSSNILRAVVWFIKDLNDSSIAVVTSRGYAIITYGKKGMTIRSENLKLPFYGHSIRHGKLEILVKKGNDFELLLIDHAGVQSRKWLYNEALKKLTASSSGFRQTYSTRYDLVYVVRDDLSIFMIRDDKTIHLPKVSVHGFFVGKDGECYFLSNNTRHQKPGNIGFSLMKISDSVISRLNPSEFRFAVGEITSYIIDQEHYFIFSPYEKKFHRVFHGKVETYRLDHVTGWTQLMDREGNLWLGGPHGLTRLFDFSIISYNREDGIVPNTQSVLTDVNDQLVIASFEHGLHVFRDGKFIQYSLTNDPFPLEKVNLYPGSARDSKGILHLMCVPYSVVRWDGRKVIYPDHYPKGGAFSFFEEPSEQRFYYGIDRGLMIQPFNGHYFIDSIFPGNKKNKIVAIRKDRKGRMVLGGFQGTSLYSKGKVIHLPTPEMPYNLGANAMANDYNGNIWIGNNDGLWLFDGDHFRKIENPFFHDFIASLYMIGTNRLFIGGLRAFGLLEVGEYYARDTVIIHYFDRENGFAGEECQQNAVTADSAGYLWFPGNNSLFRISPEQLIHQPEPPTVYITRVSLISQQLIQTNFSDLPISGTTLHFSHKDKNIRFEFSGVYFRAPNQVRYRYRLDGYSTGWSYPTVERHATFTNLTPGRYTFRVEATNESGRWSEKEASINLVIHPAFWQTWWFVLLVFLLFAGALVGTSWLIFKRIRKKKQLEQENARTLAELKFKTLRNQLAPHFIFNALNAIGASMYNHDPKESYGLLHKFSRLIRHTLTTADKTSRSLADELEFVQYYLEIEKFRFNNRITFEIVTSPGTNLETIVPRMILQTFVENAVKHGLMHKEGPGHIRIAAENSGENLLFTIEDNGIGRAAAADFSGQSTGKGLEIIREFIRLFNDFNKEKISVTITDLKSADGEALGTRVEILVPMLYSFHFDHDNKPTENDHHR